MNKVIYRVILVAFIVLATASSVMSQRRSRPGSMKHSGAEYENAVKITPAQATYIHNGSYFSGPVYFTSQDGSEGIKIYTADLKFSKGRYTLSLDAAEFSTRQAISADERAKRGISDYQYEKMWKNEKLSEDIQQSGVYKVIKQYDAIHLVLYDGDTDNIVFKIKLSSQNAKYLEFKEDNLVYKLSFVR